LKLRQIAAGAALSPSGLVVRELGAVAAAARLTLVRELGAVAAAVLLVRELDAGGSARQLAHSAAQVIGPMTPSTDSP
jgi:hypothetical protein